MGRNARGRTLRFRLVALGGAFLFLGDTAVRHDSRSSGPVPLSAEVFYNAHVSSARFLMRVAPRNVASKVGLDRFGVGSWDYEASYSSEISVDYLIAQNAGNFS